MTQFYVPYTKRVVETIEAAPPGTIFIDVSGGVTAYWEALCDIWAKGETFAIIEHDVICRPDVVEQFDACPEPWCLFGYTPICHPECQEAWRNQLGLTRFRSELMAAVPDALTSIPDEVAYRQRRRDWHNLCDELAGDKIAGVDQLTLRPGSLRAAGYSHHWHFPPVRHRSWETP